MSLANEILAGHYDNVVHLLSLDVDVNETDEYGYTPLIEAAIASQTPLAELLIKHGADVTDTDVTSNTALHWAAENNNVELCKLLLENGADANAYTHYSQSVLVKPLLRQQQTLKELLYHSGADLSFAQDYINAKLIGHRFELSGRVDIVDHRGRFVELNFEGFILEFTLSLIQNSLTHFKHNFTARNLRHRFNEIQRIIDALTVSQELIKYQHYLVNIAEHKQRIETLLSQSLLILPVAYTGHAVTFIKMGNYLVKCDRGEMSQRDSSVVIYQLTNPALFNSKFIKFLLYERQEKNFIETGFITHLRLKRITELALPSQITGNCSWANVEAVVPSVLYLSALIDGDFNNIKQHQQQALTLYRQWQNWDKDWALHQCVESFYEASPARKASKASILAAVLFQGCDFKVPKDVKRAEKILNILKHKEYQYIVKTYITVYIDKKQTEQGRNLLELIDLAGIKGL